jgi:hypothetical protein
MDFKKNRYGPVLGHSTMHLPTYPLRILNRVSEVERIHDGPFLLHLQIVVVEKAQNLFLDLHAIRVK